VQLEKATPKTPSCLVQESWTSRVISNFLLKFLNFRYHGNGGRSETNFTTTVKLADAENPRLVQESRTYLLYKPSYSQFCIQITVLGYHGNKGQSRVNLNDTIRSADSENPQFGANSVHLSSKVPELWLLEFAIGRNAIFQILG